MSNLQKIKKECSYCSTKKENVSDMLSNGYCICEDCRVEFGWSKNLETMSDKLAFQYQTGRAVITKDNIPLYYQSMSNKEKYKSRDILEDIAYGRRMDIFNKVDVERQIPGFLTNTFLIDDLRTKIEQQSFFGLKTL